MHSVLEEIYDPDFTASNFGFRRGKSQHQAIHHLLGGCSKSRFGYYTPQAWCRKGENGR